jgi:hypothetical protein
MLTKSAHDARLHDRDWKRETPVKQAGKSVEMENFFSRLTLDIIGKAVFNYEFDSLTHDDPVIQVISNAHINSIS